MQSASKRPLADALRWGVVVLSVGAAVIHFAVVSEHVEEYEPFGVFFFLIGWFQVGWAIVLARGFSRRLYVVGVVVNAIVILVWLVSRTVGLPIGPEAGTPEEAQFDDVVATGFELLLVVSLAVLISHRSQRRVDSRWVVWTVVVLAGVVVLSTGAAVLS